MCDHLEEEVERPSEKVDYESHPHTTISLAFLGHGSEVLKGKLYRFYRIRDLLDIWCNAVVFFILTFIILIIILN